MPGKRPADYPEPPLSRQARLIIAAALTALALTGCGSARPGTAPGIPRPAAHPAASSTPPGSYLNPAVVAAALKRMLRNRLADKSGPYYDPGVRPRSVNCVQEAARRDYCVASVSGNNPNVAATVIISPDGGSFVTKG
jgi:hypothetical protein